MTDQDLVAELKAAEQNSNQAWRGECQVCAALEKMSPEAAEVVRNAVEGRTIGNERLAKIITDHGYPTGRRAIIRHQKGHTS